MIIGNDVDGYSLFHLTEQDFLEMFPSKRGRARKIVSLVQEAKQQVECKLFEPTIKSAVVRRNPANDSDGKTCIQLLEGIEQGIIEEASEAEDTSSETIDEDEYCPHAKKPCYTHSETTALSGSIKASMGEFFSTYNPQSTGHGSASKSTAISGWTKPSLGRSSVLSPSTGHSTAASASDGTSAPFEESELPNFSDRVKSALQQQKVMKEWDRFIEECAYFILAKGDFKKNNKESVKQQYQSFGIKICSVYPCVEADYKKHKYSFFLEKLSQKLRNIRWRQNKRSEAVVVEEEKKKWKKHTFTVVDDSADQGEQFQHDLISMQEELKSAKPDKAKLVTLQKKSFNGRRKDLADSCNVLEKYPILGEIYYIKKEFFLLTNKSEDDIHKAWTREFQILEKYLQMPKDCKSEIEEHNLNLLLELQKRLRISSHKKNLPECISEISPAEALELKATSKTAPHLVIIRHQFAEKMEGFIVAEKMVKVQAEKVGELVNALIYCYYAWDLSYPLIHSNILGYIQERILNDNSPFKKGTAYVKTVTGIRNLETEN